MMDDQGSVIRHDDHERKFFWLTPNLVDEMGLNVYERALYTHYLRRGTTWEGVRTTARVTGMSLGSVVNHRSGLADKGLISITDRDPDGQEITVVNIWALNVDYYAKGAAWVVSSHHRDEHPSLMAHLEKVWGVHHMNAPVHQVNAPRSPDERKNTNNKEDSQKKKQKREVPVPGTSRKTGPGTGGKAKRGKNRDPRLDHPAIKAFRRHLNQHSRKVQRDRIIQAVGSSPDSQDLWEKTCEYWAKHAWPPHDYDGLLDRFGKFRNGNRADLALLESQGEKGGASISELLARGNAR